MTVNVSVTEGSDLRALFEGGEGTWAGRGAEALGLTGKAKDEDLREVVRRAPEAKPFDLLAEMRLDGTL
jgi:hypothetical protein